MSILQGCVPISGIHDRDLINRFMSFVPIRQGGQCWIWEGGLSGGYGVFRIKGISRRAHIISYEIHYGTIPSSLLVLHKCDVKRCVNPDHLELGDYSKNLQDRYNRNKTHRNVSKFSASDVNEMKLLRQDFHLSCEKIAIMYNCGREIIRLLTTNKITHLRSE